MTATFWYHRANGDMFYATGHRYDLNDALLIGARIIRDFAHPEGTRGTFRITEVEVESDELGLRAIVQAIEVAL